MRINISLSAVPLDVYKKYNVKGWNKARYADLFQKYDHDRNAYRIYLPLGKAASTKKIRVPQAVSDQVSSKGYVIDNYLAGTAINPNTNRTIKIGKLLDDADVKKLFDNDSQRSNVKNVASWVVISRHPYDIIGSSFDRGWTSCMHAGHGINRHYLDADIKHGALVAYLVKELDKDGKNINNPVARITIKPYINEDGDIGLFGGAVYGIAPKAFDNTVTEFCAQYNKGLPHGTYSLAGGLYADGMSARYILGPDWYKSPDAEDILNTEQNLPEETVREGYNNDLQEAAIQHQNAPEDILRDAYFNSGIRYFEKLVAENDNAPEDVLLDAYDKGNETIRKSVILNDNVPESVLLKALDDDDSEIAYSVLNNPNVTLAIIRKALVNIDSGIVIQALKHKKCPAALINGEVANDKSDVRQTVAQLTKDVNVLELLAKDPNSTVSTNAISNPKCAVALLSEYAQNGRPDRRMAVASNVSCPPNILNFLAQDKDGIVRENVLLNASCPEDTAIAIVKRGVETSCLLKLLTVNVTLPTTVLGILTTDSSARVRMKIATHQNSDEPILLLLVHDYATEVAKAAVLNTNATDKVKLEALKDERREISTAIFNTRLPLSILQVALDSDNIDVVAEAIKNEGIINKLLHETYVRLLGDDSEYGIYLRAQIAESPKLSVETIAVIAKSKFAYIKEALVRNERVHSEILMQLYKDALEPSTDKYVMQSRYAIRLGAVKHPNATLPIVELALSDPEMAIREEADTRKIHLEYIEKYR